jgi:lipoprotein signal peptidase
MSGAGPAPRPAPASRSGVWPGLAALLIVLAADQASKWWVLDILRLAPGRPVRVLPVLNLALVWNRGVTFGLLGRGAVGAWAFVAVALAVVAGLLVWMKRAESRLAAVAIGAVAGGAIGNVVDRVRYGAVVDFIDAHAFGWHWYVFNVADAAIVCGVIALVLDGLRRRPHDSLADGPARL